MPKQSSHDASSQSKGTERQPARTSWEAMQRAYEADIPATDKLVLIGFASHLNKATGRSFPSLARIGRETRLNRSTVVRAVARLRPAGWMRVEKEGTRTSAVQYSLWSGRCYTHLPENEHVGALSPEVGAQSQKGRCTERHQPSINKKRTNARDALSAPPSQEGRAGASASETDRRIPEWVWNRARQQLRRTIPVIDFECFIESLVDARREDEGAPQLHLMVAGNGRAMAGALRYREEIRAAVRELFPQFGGLNVYCA